MFLTACPLDQAWSSVIPSAEEESGSSDWEVRKPKKSKITSASATSRPPDCDHQRSHEDGSSPSEQPAAALPLPDAAPPAVQLAQKRSPAAPERLATLLLVVVVALMMLVMLAFVIIIDRRTARMGIALHQMQYRLHTMR